MELKDFLGKLESANKELARQLKALKDIHKLDKERRQNAPRIGDLLKAVDPSKLGADLPPAEECRHWLAGYKAEIAQLLEEANRRFGIRLEEALSARGIPFAQKGGGIASGVFLIEWDPQARSATIWFGQRKEKVAKCGLDPEKIAEEVEKARRELGSPLEPADLIAKMRRAYQRALDPKGNGYVPVSRLLAELSFLLQDSRFAEFPTKENFRTYSRADLSFDLFRARHEAVKAGMQLKTATLAATSKRQNFLWVPTADSIEGGNHYAEIKFEENHR